MAGPPNLTYKQVPTAGQWNSYFATKQDVLGYIPVNRGGDTMFGRLNMLASSTAGAGLNLPQGTAPTSPKDGDIWTTNTGFYGQIAGSTVGPWRAGGVSGPNVAVANDLAIFSDVTGGVLADAGVSVASLLLKADNLSDLANASTARSNIAVGPHVASRTILAGLTPSENLEVFLLEAGRQGTFLWNGADLSASVTADPFQGVFVPPTGQTGSGGAWVRVTNGFVLSPWFGIGTANDTAMLNSAVVVASRLSVPLVLSGAITLGSEPTISVPVTIQGLPGSYIDGTSIACINIGAVTIAALQISGVEFRNFTRAAIWLNQGATVKYLNITNNVFTNCRLALSNQGDTTNPSYDPAWYYVPQPGSFINRMIFSGNLIDGTSTLGKGGIALSCAVTDYNVEKNTFKNMVNSDTSGSDNALTLVGVYIFLDGYAEGSPNYNLIRRGVVSGNHFYNGIQNVAAKGANAIQLTGTLIIAANNNIELWYNSNATNPSNPIGNNDEPIYGKALQYIIDGNTILNSGGSQAAINIKGTEVGEGNPTPYGMFRMVTNNVVRWTSDGPITHYKTGVEVECAPATIANNIFEGLSAAGFGVLLRGSLGTSSISQSRVIIEGNRFQGAHGAAVTCLGANVGADIQNNVNIVDGGGATGQNIAFMSFSEVRTNAAWGTFVIQGNYHAVTNLTVGTFNCAVRIQGVASVTAVPIAAIHLENNTFNHFIAGQACQGVNGSNPSGANFPVNKITMKNNHWPANIGTGLINLPTTANAQIICSFDIDETLNFTTTNNTATNALVIPVFGNGSGSINITANAQDITNFNSAYYGRSTAVKAIAGTVTRVGTQNSLFTNEDTGATAWDCNVSIVSAIFMNISLTGDSADTVNWVLNVQANTREL